MGETILIIDDDEAIGNLEQEVLEGARYRVLRAYTGTEALLVLQNTRPDLALLDLMLPGLSGEELLPRLQGVSVIVVSAKADTDDKVDALLGGAADYVTKPFVLRELLARVAVQLRGPVQGEKASLTFQDLVLDPAAHAVTAGGRPVKLTKTEYAILHLLLANPRQVLAKSVILDRISKETPDGTERSLKQHMSNLRKKLRQAGGREYIQAVWGIGFCLTEAGS